jgi:hypothetical protein
MEFLYNALQHVWPNRSHLWCHYQAITPEAKSYYWAPKSLHADLYPRSASALGPPGILDTGTMRVKSSV